MAGNLLQPVEGPESHYELVVHCGTMRVITIIILLKKSVRLNKDIYVTGLNLGLFRFTFQLIVMLMHYPCTVSYY